jgi:ZIP family zinc transporter
MAVAIPLYASTGNIFQVLLWTLVNGLAEPFGVIMGGALLAPYLDEYVLSRCLAIVSGIMFCISLHELYPVSIKYCGKGLASFSLFLGMFLCWGALEMVEVYFGHSHEHHPDLHHLGHHDHHHGHHSHHHHH